MHDENFAGIVVAFMVRNGDQITVISNWNMRKHLYKIRYGKKGLSQVEVPMSCLFLEVT